MLVIEIVDHRPDQENTEPSRSPLFEREVGGNFGPIPGIESVGVRVRERDPQAISFGSHVDPDLADAGRVVSHVVGEHFLDRELQSP